VLKLADLTGPDQQFPSAVRVKHGVNRDGKYLYYSFNYPSEAQTFQYACEAGVDLLTPNPVGPLQSIRLRPWDLVIIREN
jgi:hypothetical protein